MVALLGHAQPQMTPGPALPSALAFNRNVIVLDPAHGGPDNGATLSGQVLEKDVTLALAARIRAALTSAGFTVVSTRDTDLPSAPPAPLTADQRAEIANRAHPLACMVLHATAAGSGVHLFASTLPPSAPEPSDSQYDAPAFTPTSWDEAQAVAIPQSLALAASFNTALAKAGLPALSGRAPLRPLDNLTCPAVAIELAPLLVAGSDPTPVTDADYQQRVASTLAATLRVFRDQAAAGPGSAPSAAPQGTAP